MFAVWKFPRRLLQHARNTLATPITSVRRSASGSLRKIRRSTFRGRNRARLSQVGLTVALENIHAFGDGGLHQIIVQCSQRQLEPVGQVEISSIVSRESVVRCQST